MSTTLTQSAAAAFPDRPRDSTGAGLLVSMTQGAGGEYVQHDLASEQAVLHMRLLMNPATASNGAVRIAGGNDAQRHETWFIEYDTDARQLTANLADGTMLSATLNALPWHAVELKIDTSAGEAELWINGLPVDSATGGYADLAAQYVWLGAVFKDTALAGDIHLDEWTIADSYIGPVIVPPATDYANDPARWLVLYNSAVPNSIAWAESYRAARNIPFANLLGLALPTTETINQTQYENLVNSSNDYLTRNHLDAQVMGVLVGYRVPGYVDFTGAGSLEPVPTMLQTNHTSASPLFNPFADNTLPERPTVQDTQPTYRLTARIDGPDLTGAQALTQRATHLINNGLGENQSPDYGENARLYLDAFAGDSALVDDYVDRMLDWAKSIDRMRLRLPIEYSGDPEQPEQDADFADIHDDAFLWSWDRSVPPNPPAGFFAEPAGPRVFSLQLHPTDPVATTVRHGTPSNWIDVALDAGYAAAAAGSKIYSTSAIPYIRPFFEALRRGWTLGEAWFVSVAMLREGLYLVGDPLLTVDLPKRGWDVYGPLDRLDALAPDTPTHALRNTQTQLALTDAQKPGVGETAHYMVRHIDAHGRHEASTTNIRVTNQAGVSALPPLTPMWPDQLDWPVQVESGAPVPRLMWDRPIGACRVSRVELRGEVDGAADVTLAEPTLDPRHTFVEAAVSLPAQQARYRWRITSSDGAVMHSPWSRTLEPAPASGVSLNVLEVKP